MAVFRVEKTKDFTIMCNHHLRNTELSLKAKGLLSLMLSLPEDWDYTTKGLAHICKDGVDSITTALKELERHGYLTRQRLRYGNGQLGDIEYTIHEKPVNAEKREYSPKRENPRQVNPGQAKPEQAEPGQENPTQLNTNPLRTKKSKTDISRTHQSIYPAEPEAAGRPDRMDRIELTDAFGRLFSSQEAGHDEKKFCAGTMPGVSKEQIQAAREADLFAYLQFHEPGVLKERIAGTRTAEPRRTSPQKPVSKVGLLVDIEAAIRSGKGPGYERWAKVFNLKQLSFVFRRSNGTRSHYRR